MDILVLLLLFALYVLPEILRRKRKPKTYKYPEFPDQQTKPEPPVINREGKPRSIVPQPAMPVSAAVSAQSPKSTQDQSATQADNVPAALDNLAYGLVMAEVLGPPRSIANRQKNRR